MCPEIRSLLVVYIECKVLPLHWQQLPGESLESQVPCSHSSSWCWAEMKSWSSNSVVVPPARGRSGMMRSNTSGRERGWGRPGEVGSGVPERGHHRRTVMLVKAMGWMLSWLKLQVTLRNSDFRPRLARNLAGLLCPTHCIANQILEIVKQQ